MGRIKSKKYTGVYLNKLKKNDISYSIMYKDITGKTYRVTIGKKSEGITEVFAFNKRNEIINKQRFGDSLDVVKKSRASVITLDTLAEVYFKDKELHNKNIKQDKNRYINHLKRPFGQRDVATIIENDLIEFQKKKLKPKPPHKKLEPKSINNLTAVMSAIINHAIKKEIYRGNNVVSRLKKLSVDNERERYLSTEEIDMLLETVKNNELLHLFCLLSFSTGARSDSVLLLQKRDIKLQQREVSRIQDTKIKNPKKAIYKGYISEGLFTLLKDVLPLLDDHDYLVSLDYGPSKMSIQQIDERLMPILNKLFNQGLDKKDSKNRTVIHTFRHTFASHLAINKTPIYTIMKLMNHQDIKSTLRYAKLAEDSGKDMVLDLYKK